MNALVQMPSAELSQQAQDALRRLPTSKSKTVRLFTKSKGEEVAIQIPQAAFSLFRQLLAEMANGRAVTLVPIHAELTTQQAAEMLNVSRPYLISLLDAEVLPYRMVGTHRRVRAEDVIKYQKASYEESGDALDELAQIAQSEDFGY